MNLSLLLIRLKKVLLTLKSPRLFRTLLRHRIISCAEQKNILFSEIATVIDIGGNRGQFALAVRNYASEARVISFEPLKEAADCFRKIFKTDPKVTLHQAAIGPESGTAIMHVSVDDDSSSIFPILPRTKQLFPRARELRTEEVEIGPLAAFVQPEEIIHPAMLKLDVQGFELDALFGCENLLDRFSYLYVECSFIEMYKGQALASEIITWLYGKKWHLDGIYNMIRDRHGNCVQADFLFKKIITNRMQTLSMESSALCV